MQESAPHSILVLGSGVFALSTLAALLARPAYRGTRFTVVAPSARHEHTASVDSTRIVRADYSDAASSRLAAAAQRLWREAPWRQHYAEPGLLLSYGEEVSANGGADYVRKSLSNVQQDESRDLQVFEDRASLTRAMNVADGNGARNTGDAGYINRRSGWADAGGALDALRARLEEEHGSRVKWIDGEAARLLVDELQTPSGKRRVTGAQLASGESLQADQTLVMTGAWTPLLLDLRGVATCTAQSMLYVSVGDAEAAQLAHLPVCFNLTRGIFFFPPTRRAVASPQGHTWEVKVAKHAYGFVNPQPTPFGTQSLPSVQGARIPPAEAAELLAFLGESLPLLDLADGGRRDVRDRVCHYLDTKTGDWLVSPHPEFEPRSLWVATGGSGHAYKFLPVLGERVAALLEGCEGDSDSELWRARWAWPAAADKNTDYVWCEDGSRAGRRGLVLAEQCAPSTDAVSAD